MRAQLAQLVQIFFSAQQVGNVQECTHVPEAVMADEGRLELGVREVRVAAARRSARPRQTAGSFAEWSRAGRDTCDRSRAEEERDDGSVQRGSHGGCEGGSQSCCFVSCFVSFLCSGRSGKSSN